MKSFRPKAVPLVDLFIENSSHIVGLILAAALLFGCAHDVNPWGYRLIENNKKKEFILPQISASDETFGFISKDKAEILKRFGKPQYLSEETFNERTTKRPVREWIYLNFAKRFYFFEDDSTLLYEEDLNPLDIVSFQGYLQDGMTPEQVLRVKGEPTRKESGMLDFGASEKWIYQTADNSTENVYFSNGMLFLWNNEDKDLRG